MNTTERTLPPTNAQGAAGEVSATLTAVHPPDLEWHLELDVNPVLIGREGPNVQELPNKTVSRRHIGIAWNGETHLVSDLGSSNGCKTNGVKLEKAAHVLDDGTVLQLGDVFLVYERTNPADAQHVSMASIPGRSAAVRQLRIQVERAAGDPSPVLLLGETGTGKEWIARELHRLSGRAGPIVALNCAALGSQIVESQLFGHVKGAFTGATTDQPGLFRAAHGGTLFLDEVGELPLDLQPKLLRALQDGQIMPVGGTRAFQVDVRVVSATNRNLAEAIEQRLFRLDLYSRLALWEIEIPPLRARRSDIPSWLRRMSDTWCAARSIARRSLPLLPEVVEVLLLHPWSDNLRGIDRLIHALRANPALAQVSLADLPAWLLARTPPKIDAAASMPALPAIADEPRTKRRPAPSREEFERAYAEHGGNVRALARHFDRDRRQIYRWMDTYGLQRKPDDDV